MATVFKRESASGRPPKLGEVEWSARNPRATTRCGSVPGCGVFHSRNGPEADPRRYSSFGVCWNGLLTAAAPGLPQTERRKVLSRRTGFRPCSPMLTICVLANTYCPMNGDEAGQVKREPERGGKAPKLLDTVRENLRVRHYSLRTEETYVHWIRRYILFHKKRHPRERAAAEIWDCLTPLAVAGRWRQITMPA